MQRHELLLVVAASFLVAVATGYLDYETQSVVHLFTAEWGNIATLAILTFCFSAMGCFAIVMLRRTSLHG